MHFSTSFVAAVAALLSASTVDAHMKIGKPTPFLPKDLNNSPLMGNGADFPCKFSKAEGYFPETRQVPPENVFAIGEAQTLSFIGSAVHGGGSCQLSLTEDPIPNKNSVWKVIHSIEGGCPSSADGNLAENANGSGADQFTWKIPSSITPGEYTFAWSWLNRIGNREFYMNCAPITVTAGVKRRYTPTPRSHSDNKVTLAKRQDLPEMFVANINGCMTEEGVDIRYPQPGPSLDLAGVASRLLGLNAPVCTRADGTQVMPGAGGNPGNPGGPGGPGSPEPSPPPSPSFPPPAKTPEAALISTPPAVSPGSFATQAPEASPPANPPPAIPAAADPPTGGSSGNGSAMSGACSNEGEWNCIGGTQFQRCASGQWSALMPVALGTQCTSTSGNFAIAAVAKKRDVGARKHRRRGHF
ncbi:hypothetical protein ACJ72_02281 [Emergomyces africanus]|uniref:Lytic polysaccharide monooxygenase n=1 Tax=Emergomyces africanus TaxID=1955775 RepID=A0A1B7P2U5_9EURO|nr:hypothetical protein ACJ72_02281 [Emergomyces africanus]